jgi:hypothetical protein
MIDILNEKVIRLEDVRNYLPSSRKGKYLSRTLCSRWATSGVNGVVLETVRIGRRARFTSVEAIERFVRAQNQARPGSISTTASTSPTRTRRSQAQVSAALSKHGV